MAQYLHPGVYIEEQPAPQTIEGVSTSTAGFVGVTEKGPTSGLPRLVTSFADFLRLYGGYLPEEAWGETRFLAYAVDGFFNNGGQRVYIKRVVGDGAIAASLTLNDGFITRLAEDTAGERSARDRVRLVSLRGISVGTDLTFRQTIAGTDETQTEEVIAYSNASGTVTLANPLDRRYTAAGCEVLIDGVPEPSAGEASLTIEANSEGAWGDAMSVSVLDETGGVGLAQAAAVETTLRAIDLAFGAGGGPDAGATDVVLDAASFGTLADGDIVEFENPTGESERRTITTAAGNTVEWSGPDNGPLENAYTETGSTVQRITAIREAATDPVVPVSDTTGFREGDLVRLRRGADSQIVRISSAGGSVDAAAREISLDTSTFPIVRVYEAGDRFGLATAGRSDSDRLDLRSVSNFYPRAVIEIDDGTTRSYHTVDSIDGQSLVLADDLGRDVPGGTAVRVVEFTLSLDDRTTSESFSNLSLDEDAPNFVEDVVNTRSRVVRVTAMGSTRPAPFNLPRTRTGGTANLQSGDDGEPPTVDHYRGEDNGPGKRTGIKALSDIDDVSIIAAPGISDPSVQAELILQCEELKDRFAVLDPSVGSEIGSGDEEDVVVQRNNHDTLYAAIYYPWLRIRDPLYPDDRSGRLVPPSGHIVGVYARVDTERGVHKAPANEVLRGITGLELKLSDRDQGSLNPRNINVVRDFRESGRGIRVWGARCITSDNAWKYVPVRRLFIFVEESLDEGLQWVVFEPNAEPLWARVRRTVTGFLRRLWLDGALAGVTEDEAFFVRCDRTTMTEDDLANGRLIVLVGIAPVRPAEFVIIRISQKTLEAAAA